MLETHKKSNIRPNEIAWLAFNTGVLFCDIMFTVLMASVFNAHYNLNEFPARYYAYRFFYSLNLILYGAGFLILMFQRVGINYTYIFEVSSQGQISPYSLVIYSQWMSLGFFLCKYLHVFFVMAQTIMLRTMLMTAFTVIFFCLPVRKLKGMKREFLITFGNYWINPFGRTQFRDMIMANSMLTFKLVITDGAWLVCLYTSGAIVDGIPPMCSTWLPIVGYFMGFSVYWLCSM